MSIDHNFKRNSIPTQLPQETPAYVQLGKNSKKPARPDWQNNPERFEDIDLANGNIGLLLGKRTGFVDIDCDCEEAVHLAGCLLPEPSVHFQRNKASAHYIYRCENSGRTVRRSFDSTLVELRSTGGQTMIPPSIHPAGDTLEWSSKGRTSEALDFDYLKKLVNLISSACLVIRVYTEGIRHSVSLGFAGLLRKAGVSETECETLIQAIADWSGDREDRLVNVSTTYQKDIRDVAGYSLLQDHLRPDELKNICQWLEIAAEVQALDGEVLDPSEQPKVVQAITSETVSEAVLAENFSEEVINKHCFVPEERQWRYWDNTRWRPDDRNVLSASFMDFIRKKKTQANDRYLQDELQRFETSYKADSVAKLSQAKCAVEAGEFDKQDQLLNCPNGVLDLSSKVLKLHKPQDYLTKQTTTNYDPAARAPLFEKFVLEICNNDSELSGYLQRVSGYALEGGNPEQAMFILHGRGANGRSTFVEVCSDVLGSYAKTAPSSVLIEGRSGGVGDDMVFLKGARWINASETGQGSYLAENKLKQITGGDTTAGRALYASYQEFQLSGVVLFSTNHLPKVKGTDEGIWRRINVIEFKRTFTEEERDPHLKDSLLAERSGVLNWMLEGHRQYKEEGLRPPESVRDATLRYRKDMDVVSGFIDECCEFDPEAQVHQTRLNQAFRIYVERSGRESASWGDIASELETRGATKKKVRGLRFWYGLKLTDD